MKLSYRPFKNTDRQELMTMITSLYFEDPDGQKMDEGKINKTIHFLSNNPQSGSILILTYEEKIVGYCIMIRYWSNEYGGELTFVDELFIKQEYRSHGFGSQFIKLFAKERQSVSKAILLEVFPYNQKAFNFYLKNGFEKNRGQFLKLNLS